MIAYEDGAHRCYDTAPDLRSRRYRGCSHATPREAIRHKTAQYVPASRTAGMDPSGTTLLDAPNRAAASRTVAPSLPSEAPSLVASPRGEEASPAPRPLDIEPAVGGALSLGL